MWFTIRKDKQIVSLSGIDQPDGEIVGRSQYGAIAPGDLIAIKVPGHKYWSQLPPGPTHSYAPAEFQILRIDETEDIGEVLHCKGEVVLRFLARKEKV